MIGDPDPFTATMNAVGYFFISEIVISTLPGNRSAWLEGGLVDRIKRQTGKPVSHVESTPTQASAGVMAIAGTTGAVAHADDVHDHHGPPRGQPLLAGGPADARDAAFHHLGDHGLRGLLHGLLLHPGRGRAPSGRAPDAELPKLIAGFNTAILVCSSFTLHWAETCIKADNRAGFKAGMLTTFLLGCTFLFIQINEYVNLQLPRRRPTRRARSSTASPACTAPTSSSASRCCAMVVRPRLPRPLLLDARTAASRCRASTGTSST